MHAISLSNFSKSVTIKGGVLIRSITDNVRRATQDMDIDFIKYSLSDNSIDAFIAKLNCIDGISIVRTGKIIELKQQDYHGKSVYITISDSSGHHILSKIDFGVHKDFEITQEEYCFDIYDNDLKVSLLVNSKEQLFVEKLKSLLKFGAFSTRYKDIYDMFYFLPKLNITKEIALIQSSIFLDTKMRENNMSDICKRLNGVFSNLEYKQRVNKYEKRWLDDDINDIFLSIQTHFESFNN